MIAQVVFDLPLDGPFDYLIPSHLSDQITVGMRVQVSFGAKSRIGFVVRLLSQSAIPKLKFLQAALDTAAVFNALDLAFAQEFSAYYGCSLGETLSTMHRSQETFRASLRREAKPLVSLYRCSVGRYAVKIQEIIDGYCRLQARSFLILVPDTFRAKMLSQQFKCEGTVKIGTRSGVFESDGRWTCVVMVDDEDASYKQEQMPMYETRDVLLMRSKIYGFDVAFVGTSPSVELMALVGAHKIKLNHDTGTPTAAVTTIDLSNYKFMPGMVSPPVYVALGAALKAAKKSLLVLNRRGSYRITRCGDCEEVLKCSRCDSPLIYSRSAGKYLCRHCPSSASGDVVCSKCHKSNWRSKGIGVEQIQAELKKYFPQARIASFERAASVKLSKDSVIASAAKQSLPDFDILISTRAVLRFQGLWQVPMAAFIDFDAELNRLDIRSSCHAFSLARHISDMTLERVFIQTRNIHHHVIAGLKAQDSQKFYDEELRMRQEFGFSPFKHWIKITLRAKSEKSAQETSAQVYNQLSAMDHSHYLVMPPLADVVTRKREQFLFNVMVQTDQVQDAMAFIKSALGQMKRRSRVFVTLNVDP